MNDKQQIINELNSLVQLHRSKDLLTCSENCFCWNIDSFIMNLEK